MTDKMNKKAVSVMLSYVLLIVIVISLGALVYKYVLSNLPQDTEACPNDLSVIIRDYNCTAGILELDVQNKGLFDVDGYYIRASNETGRENIIMLNKIGGIGEKGRVKWLDKLGPGEENKDFFQYSEYGNLTSLEIEPFIIKDKKLVLCPESLVKQDIGCS